MIRFVPEAASAATAIDVGGAFGPLASMHAALERAGVGMRCGVVARFPDASAAAIEAAVRAAASLFPVLQMRLTWQSERPMLVPAGAEAGANDQCWGYRLEQVDGDVHFSADWPHAMADGLSMLRFVQAIGDLVAGRTPLLTPRRAGAIGRQGGFLQWFPRFLAEQQRDCLTWEGWPSPSGTSWLVLPPARRDALLARAPDECGGMAGWLAAAAALAFAEHRGAARARLMLNIPVARRTLEAFNGFGFGVSSLRFAAAIDRRQDIAPLARALSRRIRHAAASGWDANLDRLLSANPKRHHRFARIEASRPPDANLTVSWKGMHPGLGGAGQPRDVACHAAAPTLHLSAHADEGGLSLSLTAPRPAEERAALLDAIAARLGGTAAERGRILHLTPSGLIEEAATTRPRQALPA